MSGKISAISRPVLLRASSARYQTSTAETAGSPRRRQGRATGTASAVTDSAGSDGLGVTTRESLGRASEAFGTKAKDGVINHKGSLRKNAIVAEVKRGTSCAPVGLRALASLSQLSNGALVLRR